MHALVKFVWFSSGYYFSISQNFSANMWMHWKLPLLTYLTYSQETFLRFACFQLKVSVEVIFSPEGRPINVSHREWSNFPGEQFKSITQVLQSKCWSSFAFYVNFEIKKKWLTKILLIIYWLLYISRYVNTKWTSRK